MAATTVNFVKGDVCSWKMFPAESELYFGRLFNITIEKMNDVDCQILYGPTIDELTNSINCTESKTKVFKNITST